ncbi:MAG TPA: lytic transglycosylase domain-containing protein [Thermohalobaculum sp.]|nr:lytic transglycosylase domain-containing protein [Thermohalobaculum sp.]
MLKNSISVGDRSRMHIVRVPRPGERIILPRPEPVSAPVETPVHDTPIRRESRPKTRPANHDWFWVSNNPRAAASPARWHQAIESVRSRTAPIVSRRTLRTIAARFRNQIATAARKHDVSESLILAVIAVESAGRPDARSHAGAEGLMQLIPATAQRFGVTNSLDPVQNIDGGAAYLDWLLGTFKGDILLALAGYNAGEGAVAKHRGVPPYSETRDYVVKVIDALIGASELCEEAPAGPRRACLWREFGEATAAAG